MYPSTRTIIEITSAAAAVYLIADAYRANSKLRKLAKKQGEALLYMVDTLDRHKVPLTKFDLIAMETITNQ